MKKKNDINMLDSRVYADATHKNDSQVSESGRSMTEMLGVLAIIGVLSVGGIVGYSYGMDKYRANQTINDVMLRAVDIITHAGQSENFNDEAWPNENPVGYATSFVEDEDGHIGIQITGVPSRVCQMVGDGLKTTAEVYVDNADYATAEDPCNSSEENTMSFFFEPVETAFGECKTDTDCGDDRYCDMGLCFYGSKPEVTANIMGGTCETDADCNTGWTGNNCAYCDATYGCVEDRRNHNKACTLTDGNVAGKCGAGECNTSGCNESNPCKGDKEYCASPNTYASSNCKAFYDNEEGMCIVANTTFSRVNLAGKNYYISNGPISWWDADAACKVLGSDGLVGVSDLVTGWAGKGDDNSHEFTALGAALQSHLETVYLLVWTSDDYDSCNAFYVAPGNGYVGNGARDGLDNGYFAVCK